MKKGRGGSLGTLARVSRLVSEFLHYQSDCIIALQEFREVQETGIFGEQRMRLSESVEQARIERVTLPAGRSRKGIKFVLRRDVVVSLLTGQWECLRLILRRYVRQSML